MVVIIVLYNTSNKSVGRDSFVPLPKHVVCSRVGRCVLYRAQCGGFKGSISIFVFLSLALRPVTVFRTGPVWPLEDIEALSEHEEGGRHYPYLTTYNLPWDHYIFFGSL